MHSKKVKDLSYHDMLNKNFTLENSDDKKNNYFFVYQNELAKVFGKNENYSR